MFLVYPLLNEFQSLIEAIFRLPQAPYSNGRLEIWSYFPQLDNNKKMIQNDNKIKVINKFDQGQIVFDKRIQLFSIIIAQDLMQNLVCFQIPSQIGLHTKDIQSIRNFLEQHNYEPKQITTLQVQYKKPCSITNQKTVKFINEHIANKTDEQIRRLIQTANYLKIQCLTRTLYLHLAEKYFIPFRDAQTKQLLTKFQVQNYPKTDLIALKQKYFQYFKIHGATILEQIEKKTEKLNTSN